MPQTKPTTKPRTKLRKREILLALALGAAGTGGAAIMLAEMRDDGTRNVPIARVEAPQDYQVGEFDEIAIIGPQDVVISTGEAPSVRSEGSPEAIAGIQVVVEDGRLEIRPGEDFEGDWSSLEGATFYVTVPMIRQVTMAGSGDVRIDRVEGDRFEGTLAGTGELAIARMLVMDVDLSLAGTGNITAAGDANDVKVTVGGTGDVRAGALDTSTANVTVAGPGNVALSVQERARMSIFGSGDVAITGNASCSVSKMGDGEVTCNGRPVDD